MNNNNETTKPVSWKSSWRSLLALLKAQETHSKQATSKSQNDGKSVEEYQSSLEKFLTKSSNSFDQYQECESNDISDQNLPEDYFYTLAESESEDTSQDEDELMNFGFEPIIDYRSNGDYPIDSSEVKDTLQESALDALSLDSIIFRHTLLAISGSDAENNKEIDQIAALFNFLYQNRPYKEDKNDKRPVILNHNVLNNIKMFREIDDRRFYKKTLYNLQKCNQCFYDSNLIEEQTKTQCDEIISNLQRNLIVNNESEEGSNSPKEEDVSALVKIKEMLSLELDKRRNKTSFYFIKKTLEDLWYLVKPYKLSKDYEFHDKDQVEQIHSLASTIYKAIKKSMKEYKTYYEYDIFEHSPNLNETKSVLNQRPMKPRKIWTSLLICYYNYLDKLKFFLIHERFNPYLFERKGFVNTLLSNALSLLTSKKVLHVNWELITQLHEAYQELAEISKVSKSSRPSFFRKDIITSNVSVFLQTKEQDKEKELFMCFPTETSINEDLNIENDHQNYEAKLDYILKNTAESIVINIKKVEKVQGIITKVEKISIDLYLTHYNNYLFKLIQNKAPQVIIPHIKNSLNLSIVSSLESFDYFFYYSFKDDIGLNKIDKCTVKEISFFNYNYLERILLRKSCRSYNSRTFYILEEDSSLWEFVNQPGFFSGISQETQSGIKKELEKRKMRKQRVIKELAQRKEKLNTIGLKSDYGEGEEWTYERFFNEITSKPYTERNKKWIGSFRAPKANNWSNRNLVIIRDYFREVYN